MYRILLADDEGIVIESLEYIIQRNFGESCEVRAAKTGRSAIEQSEEFQPDIIFMDIQMPGINGIEAMKEIRKTNQKVVFIVMTAYDKFDFAKESIHLGVMEYLTKPANPHKITSTIERAIAIVDRDRKKRSEDLRTKEKLETVIPLIENGFIYTILFQEAYSDDMENFRELLGINQDYGFIIVVQFGEIGDKGTLTNVIGISIQAQGFYTEFREIAREFFRCITGPVMANKIVLFVPWGSEQMEYEERIHNIEKTRNLIRKLTKRIKVHFRAGIGGVKRFIDLSESYKEAAAFLNFNQDKVVHSKDISAAGSYEGEYPIDTERRMFIMIERGDTAGARAEADRFFHWMIENYPDNREDVQLKVLELIMRAEKRAFQSGKTAYGFLHRRGYLKEVLAASNHSDLKRWFLDKISNLCGFMGCRGREPDNRIVSSAKDYIKRNFHRDVSLEDVSKSVDISPYYFSKLFKEETGINFIEYLTEVRLERAKELLTDPKITMKEICSRVGYSDPNYFSRIFKKCTGMTPTDFREGGYR